MKISPVRRLVVVVGLAALAVGCTAPAGGESAIPTAPAASVAPSASPAASGGGKYGDEAKPSDPYVDEYATPKP